MKKLLILLLSGLLIAGCTGADTVATQDGLTPTRTVGNGSGHLNVDGRALGIQPGEVVAIAPGSYESLTFSNLTGTPGQRITLVANGLVEVVGGALSLTDVSYLTVYRWCPRPKTCSCATMRTGALPFRAAFRRR